MKVKRNLTIPYKPEGNAKSLILNLFITPTGLLQPERAFGEVGLGKTPMGAEKRLYDRPTRSGYDAGDNLNT